MNTRSRQRSQSDQHHQEMDEIIVEDEDTEISQYGIAPEEEEDEEVEEEIVEEGIVKPSMIGTRAEKSLGLLTQRFLRLLQTTRSGIVDLNTAAEDLNVRQKRRIYDITNVLEGVGLIEKKSKNIIQWKGGELRKPGVKELKPEEEERLFKLKLELADQEREERLLDTHLKWLKQSIRNVSEYHLNQKLAYVTQEDLLEVFPESTLLVVQAPSGTCVEVQHSPKFRDIDMRYEMHLKSPCGPAAVILVNKDDMLQQQFANLSGRFQSISKNVFSDEPGQILEDEDDEGGYLKKRRPEDDLNDPKGPEILRRLSPPPSERDYIFNLNQGESLLDLYQDDTM